MLTAEIQRLRREMESSSERWERDRESLQQQLVTADSDHKTALQQGRYSHEQEVARLTDVQASIA